MRIKTIVTALAMIGITTFAFWWCGKQKPEPPDEQLAVVGMQGGDTIVVNVGKNFSATFMIGNARNVYAIAALVEYDTSYIAVVRNPDNSVAMPGTFLGATGDLTAAFVNGMAGKIVFAYSKQGNQPGSDGTGELWRLTMLARRAGLTKIAFDLSRSSVMSPVVVGGGLEMLPSKFEDKLLKISQPVPAADTVIVYIRIN